MPSNMVFKFNITKRESRKIKAIVIWKKKNNYRETIFLVKLLSLKITDSKSCLVFFTYNIFTSVMMFRACFGELCYLCSFIQR